MNAAYVSDALFRDACHNNGVEKNADLLPSSQSSTAQSPSSGYYALLSLDSPYSQDAQVVVVRTALRLVPICAQNEIANDDDYGGVEKTIHIHPLLLRVLLRSSHNIAKQTCAKRSEDTNVSQPVASRHRVILSSHDGSMHHGATGWLEHFHAENIVPNSVEHSTECNATIHLMYMCSNNPRGRAYFGSKSSKNAHAKKDGIDLIMKMLVGEVVAEGGILAIDIGKSNGMYVSPGMDFDYDGNDHQEVVFFMVNKIWMKDGTVPKKDSRFLRLWPHQSFNIHLDLPNTITVPRGNDSNPRIPQGNDRSTNVQEDNMHYSCPGYESVLEELLTLSKMDNPDGAPTAVMLSGCSGVGKSRMASWFRRELSRSFESSPVNVSIISARDILLDEASFSFDQYKVLHQLRTSQSSKNAACPDRVLIVDDMDAIIGNIDETDSSSATNLESEQLRALNSIVKLIDATINDVSNRYFVLGISRASWAQLPLQLARVGRFEKIVPMSPPTLGQRKDIFKFWLSTLPLLDSTDKDSTVAQWADLLAPRTAGCVAADIRRICADALTSAAARVPRTIGINSYFNDCAVKWDDIKEAARTCVPSQLSSMDVIPASSADYFGKTQQSMDAKQEFELAWRFFGGYAAEKKRLYRTVVRPWKYHITETATISKNLNDSAHSSSVEATLGMSKPSGVLFHGPSGTGKTFAAMCLASSLGLHCVKVRASEVFSQWLGGSEATLRSIFSRARAASPCILFFDELDALATNREGGDSDATSGVQSRILTTLLNEMDGITNAGGKQGVLVVATTNRLDAIDAALLRPGRLEEHVLLSNPKSICIRDILKIQTEKMPLNDDVDLTRLSGMLELSQASCAEIEGICRDACLIAMRRCSEKAMLDNLSVQSSDFDKAFRRIKNLPSSSK
eukprot:CAMPEP_0181121864 /NCGR_PEP_ID=MMETSP1071-20121207/24983_1 /TAXON_ID=35127 /ORGANISM="Thalassiosira sp., Strain NH16" /LENGTH=906 /DNA_ID=CAMNT_0023206747 /DNA_START=72 /DNA_END=2792 /DNA_ORIENTATION=+